MNSLVSYDWLKQYVDLKGLTPDEFAKRISLSGPGVEKIYPQGTELEKIVVGQILEVKAHPNADKLRVAIVDVGSSRVNIVCGGSNLEIGQWVAVALVGSRVKWHGQGELVTLELTEIRGVKSEGMICGADEIGLGDAFPSAEREILDLGKELGWSVGAHGVRPPIGRHAGGRAPHAPTPGTPVADVLGLSSDVVMDIEVTSNRVDAMGMVGMAREASAIFGRKFLWKSKDLPAALRPSSKKRSPLSVSLLAKKHGLRYMGVKVEDVAVGPSPWWLKRRLMSAGLRPVSLLVDISNFVMLELAHPIHIFDAAQLQGKITIRLSQSGEKMKALDGKEYEFDDSVLVIADEAGPVAVAGVLGGERASVSPETTSIVIECAAFDPVTIRRGARKLNIQSDAQLRFEKGLSLAGLPEVMARTLELVQDLAGGRVQGPVTDVGMTAYRPKCFSIHVDEVNRIIGTSVSQKEMVDRLRRLGFTLAVKGKTLTATVPWWRDQDIEDGRDLVEEIARVEGYANIPPVIPVGLAPRPMSPELIWERRAREISRASGLTEVYAYSFVSSDLLAKVEYDPSSMLHVQNPLSADFEILRTTLLPSLLQVASENRERFPEQRLFEIANVYYPTENGWTELPNEQLEFGGLWMGMEQPWRHAKGYVEHLFHEIGIKKVEWKRLDSDSFWHPGRTVQAFCHGSLVATVGEVSPRIAKNFKLDQPVGLVDIPFEELLPYVTSTRTHIPISVFPEARRDVAILVDHRVEYDDVERSIRRVSPLVTNVEWFDTYRGPNLPSGQKSLAVHVTFSAPDRTLESHEVEGVMERILLTLRETFHAELRG